MPAYPENVRSPG